TWGSATTAARKPRGSEAAVKLGASPGAVVLVSASPMSCQITRQVGCRHGCRLTMVSRVRVSPWWGSGNSVATPLGGRNGITHFCSQPAEEHPAALVAPATVSNSADSQIATYAGSMRAAHCVGDLATDRGGIAAGGSRSLVLSFGRCVATPR